MHMNVQNNAMRRAYTESSHPPPLLRTLSAYEIWLPIRFSNLSMFVLNIILGGVHPCRRPVFERMHDMCACACACDDGVLRLLWYAVGAAAISRRAHQSCA